MAALTVAKYLVLLLLRLRPGKMDFGAGTLLDHDVVALADMKAVPCLVPLDLVPCFTPFDLRP